MGAIEWFNENENRQYPLSEDILNSVGLPTSVLADVCISVPETVVDDVYLSMISISAGIVSVSFAASSGGLAVGTFARPVEAHRPYALTPVVDSVSGYVVFGAGVNDGITSGSYRFTGLSDGKVDTNALKPVEAVPVTAIRRLNSDPSDTLDGIIKLEAGTNMVLTHSGNIIKLSLVEAVRAEFLGPCDKYAIFDACGAPPIRTINGVGPSSSGKLTIEVA